MKRTDAELKHALEVDGLEAAVNLAIRAYGSELFGFIVNTTHDEDLAQDVFQTLCMEIWKSMPRFQWQSSFRTWVYVLARRTTFRALGVSKGTPVGRLHTEGEQSLQARWTRTSTLEWQKTENKDRFWLLCEGLEPEQRTLVMLRIGRRLPWNEVARIMSEEDAPSDANLRRLSGQLRKRFERTKEHLKVAMQRLSS
ncbi:MAG: RNA polymerase sigma-70 factor (ECF subfamily) [Myxococcota bacterium]